MPRIARWTADGQRLGPVLRAYRAAHGLRQVDLARALRVSTGTISYWERDWVRPTGPRLAALASLLGPTVVRYAVPQVLPHSLVARVLAEVAAGPTSTADVRAALRLSERQARYAVEVLRRRRLVTRRRGWVALTPSGRREVSP